ncbi:perlucin-like protein [Saccostrea cucullata]|uniref:perlucin-like protein n=1 Tax=Saccostrea cuccullata TaxID=36930 RepID=UPI002ED5FD3A
MAPAILMIIVLSGVVGVSSQPPPCPHGWTSRESSCYAFISDTPEDWMTAMSYCNALHATLVEIETVAEDEFLRMHLLDSKATGGYWIGLSDILVEGDWVWTSTQTNPTYSNWNPGQPDNVHHHQDCGQLYGPYRFHWDDGLCNTANNFICEKAINEDIDVIG